ncbi:MAG TPA: 3-methyl-2-oxobutanoate hydroxymethyltransferase [Planctomycetes bacterium]|nr:3-methyl-2-oxobutanoate hydroxymethyltransferase [Planctomycetota bacterium]
MEAEPTATKPSIFDFRRFKEEGRRWTCLTAYDAPTARVLASAEVPMILVGDSVGNVVLGHSDTVSVTMVMMLHHCGAVRRGAPTSFIVGDMPFLSYQVSREEAVRNAGRFLKEGAVDAVKLEGGGERAGTVEAIVRAGIPVVGHLGLTPQNATQLGGYRVQGSDPGAAAEIFDDACRLEEAGAFAIVLECIPGELAARITETIRIPTIGIGAGAACDAQVLVFHDLAGLSGNFQPRFVRRYVEMESTLIEAVRRFGEDVSSGDFPSASESFSSPKSVEELPGGPQEDRLQRDFGG